jgi:ATP-dependent exoDNAse (exonuclease V) beta subunit
LVIDGDKAKIVDYKYSKLSAEGLKRKYSLQLSLYAYAVEKVLGVKVSDKIIVSLMSGEIVKID